MVLSVRSRALAFATLALALVVGLPLGQAAPGKGRGVQADAAEDDEATTTDEATAGTASPTDASDAVLLPAIEELLVLRPCRVAGGVATLDYPLADPAEAQDFEWGGFDKVELHQVTGHRTADTGLELGAGSNQAGRLRHKLPLTGSYEIEVELWAAHNTPSAMVCFGVSDKVGVLWGQQLVNPRTLRPWSKNQPAADVTLFREERPVRAKITATNALELTVECNGRRTAAHRFTKGELRSGQFAVFARNCRIVLTSLKIRGQVDGAKL